MWHSLFCIAGMAWTHSGWLAGGRNWGLFCHRWTLPLQSQWSHWVPPSLWSHVLACPSFQPEGGVSVFTRHSHHNFPHMLVNVKVTCRDSRSLPQSHPYHCKSPNQTLSFTFTWTVNTIQEFFVYCSTARSHIMLFDSTWFHHNTEKRWTMVWLW